MPVSSVIEVPYNIALAISLASNATGVDFDYLLRTAAHESNFRSGARAKTSSAQGLYQFIEETWLRTIKEEGHRYGLEHHAARITRTRKGRYYVPDAKARKRILALRNDPKIAAVMAGEFANQNLETLREGLGRKPSAGELYIAHFLGARSAIKLIKLAKAKPSRKAYKSFRAAAKANRSIFFKRGRARTVREVYRLLAGRYDRPTKPLGHTSSRNWSTLVVNRKAPIRTRSKSTVKRKTVRQRRKRRRARHIRVAIPQLPLRKPRQTTPRPIDHKAIATATRATLPIRIAHCAAASRSPRQVVPACPPCGLVTPSTSVSSPGHARFRWPWHFNAFLLTA